jgi:hypothetical protein
MVKKKYIVSFTTEERETLEQLTTTRKSPAYKMNHTRILLKADTNQEGGGWTDTAISQALDMSVATIAPSLNCFSNSLAKVADIGIVNRGFAN